MTEEQAMKVAEAFGGDTWQSGGGIWLVLIRRKDGKLVVISEEVVCEYKSEKAFQGCHASNSIPLC